jgi:hypothetical protein
MSQIEPLEIDKQLKAAELFGKMKEGVYVAGHELERALSTLEWMLEDDRRWRSLGHETVNNFLDSINFDRELRLAAEQRKKIAKRIKELQPDASNTKIGKSAQLRVAIASAPIGDVIRKSASMCRFSRPVGRIFRHDRGRLSRGRIQVLLTAGAS